MILLLSFCFIYADQFNVKTTTIRGAPFNHCWKSCKAHLQWHSKLYQYIQCFTIAVKRMDAHTCTWNFEGSESLTTHRGACIRGLAQNSPDSFQSVFGWTNNPIQTWTCSTEPPFNIPIWRNACPNLYPISQRLEGRITCPAQQPIRWTEQP